MTGVVELSREELRAACHATSMLVNERRIAGRPVPKEVVALRDLLDAVWRTQPAVSQTGTENGPVAQRVGHSKGRTQPCPQRVSTAEAAQMLGWHVRRVRRHADELDGRIVAGRLAFDANTIRAFKARNSL